MTKISVFTPSYNKGNFAVEAIKSVLSQTFSDFEYWVLENSTDAQTREQVREIARSDKRIRYVELDFSKEVRQKEYVAPLILNEYYPKANGEYIFYLADDDLIYSHCFETCMKFMENRNDAHVGYFSLKIVEEYKSGKFRYVSEILASHERGFGTDDPHVDCRLDHGQIIYRTACLQELEQPYLPTALSQDTHHCDGLFMEKLAAKYTFYPITSEYLLEHRRTSLSTFTRPGGVFAFDHSGYLLPLPTSRVMNSVMNSYLRVRAWLRRARAALSLSQVVVHISMLARSRLRRRVIETYLNESVRLAIINLWNEIRIARMAKRSRKYFRAFEGKKGLKVNLGCGYDIKPGWINIDLASKILSPEIDPTVCSFIEFINYDLRLGLPLNSASCDIIYSSHFFEHLEYKHGLKLMRDCYEALRPGGVFRIALPNLKQWFDAYLRKDREYVELIDISRALPEVEPGTETFVDYINYGVYQSGEHKCIYDEEKISLILLKFGYSSVTISSFQKDIDPSTPERQRYSFYIEAIK
jgi:glycosyltransferase involved in cell wall biosynthesis